MFALLGSFEDSLEQAANLLKPIHYSAYYPQWDGK